MNARTTREHYLGCLIGGAIGDALGAPIEFMSLGAIRTRFGPAGLTGYAPAYGRLGAITDDTQMTLFTAEGLLQAPVHASGSRGARPNAATLRAVHRAYLRWLHTQGTPWRRQMGQRAGLVRIDELHSRRAPGNTCLGALEASLAAKRPAPFDSKGCGGVMRVAPVGLARPPDPFRLGCGIARITHGHPSGYLPAGFLAELLAALVEGESLVDAIDRCMKRLIEENGHEETAVIIRQAVELARSCRGTPEEIEELGQGWVGHEALAIALYCALRAGSFEEGVLLAVNHGGDSDSTGSISGNILGLIHGTGGVPACWIEELELRAVLETIALELCRLAARDVAPARSP